MKKITHFLRFLALVFFLFLAVVVCFVFNKALDQKISESHENTLNAVTEIYQNEENSSERQ